jgi:basic membrane protein A
VSSVTRRNFMKAAALGLAATPPLGRAAFAAEPLKVGLVYLGPIGDYGWTWAHEKGRKAMVDALKGQVIADYVENVKEDASATPIIKDLAQQGHKLIFATTFGYMDQTVEAAKQFPDVKFEHCTGYKHLPNLGTYNTRFHQGRAVEGAVAGMMTKSSTIGYLGSYKVPEVVLGVNAFTLAAQAVNPKVTTRLIMIDSWFDPAKEAAAVQTLANLGCDVVVQHTDSPAGLQAAEARKIWCFGNAADMSRFAPKMQLTAIENIWGPYYISRARAALDGTWKSDDAWWGLKEGALQRSDARQCEGGRRQDDRRLEGRLLRCLHRSDLGPNRQGARRQGPADGGQRPRRHRLVRSGRAELRAVAGVLCQRAPGKDAPWHRLFKEGRFIPLPSADGGHVAGRESADQE